MNMITFIQTRVCLQRCSWPATSTPSSARSWRSTVWPRSSTSRGTWTPSRGTRWGRYGVKGTTVQELNSLFFKRNVYGLCTFSSSTFILFNISFHYCVQWNCGLQMFKRTDNRSPRNGTNGKVFGQNFLRFVTGLDWSVVKTCILLSADFGCEVHGLVSTVRPRMDGDHVTKYFTVAELASMVAGVDYLINVLPSTPSTDNLLNR